MSLLYLLVGLVALARLAELIHARRNTRKLLAQGGVEHGANQYLFFVLLHATWLAAMVAFIFADAPVQWLWLGLFLAAQAGRVWVLVSLGEAWTTRVISVPGKPLVKRGPYRFMRHPNYFVVAVEIPALPLAFGAWQLALIFGVANLILLAWRIWVEDRALAARRELA